MQKKTILITLGSLLALIAFIFFSSNTEEKIIGLKSTIHHDDFEYSVQDVQILDKIGDQQPKGKFYVLTFQVENRAKRVSHRWDNHVAFITDENKQVIENQEIIQKIWYQESQKNFTENFETPAGQTERSVLVFDVPNTITKPYLQVRGATLMGDFFDGNQFLKVKVRLF